MLIFVTFLLIMSIMTYILLFTSEYDVVIKTVAIILVFILGIITVASLNKMDDCNIKIGKINDIVENKKKE